MFDSFDPKEKKVILLFVALLVLGVIYLSTHPVDWNTSESSRMLEGKGRTLPPSKEVPETSSRYL